MSTLKLAELIVAPFRLALYLIRQKERAVPLVSLSWPTRASEVPELKLVPFQKLVFGCGL